MDRRPTIGIKDFLCVALTLKECVSTSEQF